MTIVNKLFVVLFATTILNIYGKEVGDLCVIGATGQDGVCRLAENCPEVVVQSKRGLRPTLCGFLNLTIPIVCCEDRNLPQPNDFGFPEPENNNNNNHNQNNNNSPLIFPNEDHNLNSNFNNNNNNNFNNNNNNNNRESIAVQKCREYNKPLTGTIQVIPLVTNTEPVNISYEKCNYNGVALIVGGRPAAVGEFPFMAALGFNVEGQIKWRCGATLISERFVMTAAHCTDSRDAGAPRLVRLGELDLGKTDESPHVDYEIGRMIVHPEYRLPLKYNDIALIQTRTKVYFNEYIRPACLYTKRRFDTSTAIATGWGKTDFLASDNTEKLMKVSLNIYDNSKCEVAYNRTKFIPDGIRGTMLCAGELKGGRDTCQGDSGGPLIVTEKGNQCKFYAIGVTSFGKACAQINTPAVYTRVSDYLEWIEENVWYN